MLAPSHQRKTNALTDAIRRCRGGLISVVLFSFAINLLMLTAPLYMLQVFDRVLTSRSENTLIFLTVFAAFAFLVYWGLSNSRNRVMITLGTWLERRVSNEVLAATVSNTLGGRNSSIQPLRDLTTIRTFLAGPSVFPILDAPWTPLFLAVIFLLHPLLGWFGFAGAIVLFALALANDLATRKTLQRAGQESAVALDAAQAATRNADVIEAMGMMPNLGARWSQLSERSLSEQAEASRISGRITSAAKAIRQMLQIGILGLGAWLVLSNELTAGGMIAASILMARSLAPVDQAITSWRGSIAAGAAYQRVKALLEHAGQIQSAPPLPAPKGTVSVEQVGYKHPGERELSIKGIAFELEPGESLGLVGPTDPGANNRRTGRDRLNSTLRGQHHQDAPAGKTTLARLLVGTLKPAMGHITIVKDYIFAARQRQREMFVPSHPPGHAQADFGEALGVIGGIERKIHFLVVDLPYSDGCFVKAYPGETTETFCDGAHDAEVAAGCMRMPAGVVARVRGLRGGNLVSFARPPPLVGHVMAVGDELEVAV